ncbi:MAG: BON domain-containing protein [Candidatus Zixiibacteriota bacterium]|nr:MAG: BON domain-containing protein [candidate division Zixibacteria bacterium]
MKDRLKWNYTTSPVPNDIEMTVKNGVAALTGEVNTWAERREAGRVAFHTEGVWEMDNRLTVAGYDYR